jgi:uncharacterized protein YdiU (UPF0061 family)
MAPSLALTFDDRFAREFPEMAVPWRAAEPADPRLLVLNQPLAIELSLDPAWLASSDLTCAI